MQVGLSEHEGHMRKCRPPADTLHPTRHMSWIWHTDKAVPQADASIQASLQSLLLHKSPVCHKPAIAATVDCMEVQGGRQTHSVE